jgi:glycine/sarcosine N-methyltransferase
MPLPARFRRPWRPSARVEAGAAPVSFYRTLSDYYDLIFPEVPDTVRFIHSRLAAGSRVLDLACGTGTIAVALASRGHRVLGIDLDAAMIERARSKAGGLPVVFKSGDMLGRIEPAAGYDAVLCLGNSLVHLASEDRVASLLTACRRRLVSGGLLLLGIVNVGRFAGRQEAELPLIERRSAAGPVRFRRRYTFTAGSPFLGFHSLLTVGEGAEALRLENSIPLLVLPERRLVSLVAAAGFAAIASRDGYSERPFTVESAALVLEARVGQPAPGS